MIPIICFGEALIDCLNTGNKTVDGLTIPEFSHYPGGAPANVAVALAKLKANTFFAGKIGTDAFGKQIQTAMAYYGVNLEHLQHSDTYPTAMAFVHLDEDGERSFTFLRKDSADLHYNHEKLDWLNHKDPGILHLCSNTLCETLINATTISLIEEAKSHHWKVSVDINFRSNLWPKLSQAPGRIEALLAKADLIKASMEDIVDIWPSMAKETFIQRWKEKTIYITDGGNDVELYVNGALCKNINIPKTSVVDTTAAGDSFIAGVLYYLSRREGSSWGNDTLIKAAQLGVHCGSMTVSRAGSYSALPHSTELPAELLE